MKVVAQPAKEDIRVRGRSSYEDSSFVETMDMLRTV